MPFLLAVFWGLPRVWRDLRFCYKSASPRFSAELPDFRLSTLKRYVEALGGELEVVAAFGDKRVRLRAVG
jgi:hypothetical protein